MLGDQLEQNIREAWLKLRQRILSDPHELHRRLARLRTSAPVPP